jgi:ABC-type transport system involved in cytochrome bd biosynthesis fused ATPase/permease subunit
VLLAVDAGIGVLAALIIVVQATAIAAVAARGFDGAPLAEVGAGVALVAGLAALRARVRLGIRGRRPAGGGATFSRACAQGSSSSGCAAGPPRWTAPRAPKWPRPRLQGVDALEAYFARYLPQLVLATIVRSS